MRTTCPIPLRMPWSCQEVSVKDALDPDVLNDTAALAAEMGTQLYNFANVIGEYLTNLDEDDDD